MIIMITGITHRSGEMRVKLKQYQGNSPKTKEKAGKSLIQKISKTSQNVHKKMISESKMHGKSMVNGCAKVEFEKNKRVYSS